MKIVKILGGIIIVLVIVIGAGLYFGLSQINRIVEDIIENVGTETLQTAVNVSAVDIVLLEGKGSIKGFTVANPKGFSNNSVMTIGDVGVQIDIESITKDVKVIKEVYIDAITLRAEQKNITDTNIQALLDNLKSNSDSASGGTSADAEGADVRLMIESLRIGDSSIALETEKFGGRTVKLPGYTQKNIGDKSKGLTPEQMSEVIMSSLLTRMKSAVTKELKNLVGDELKAKAKEKIDEAKAKAAEKLQEKLGDKVKAGDIDKLKGLFN